MNGSWPKRRAGPARSWLRMAVGIALAGSAMLAARPVAAQEDCKLLFCSPTFTVQPGVVTTNTIEPPEVRRLGGTVTELGASTDFLLRFGLFVPTFLPRTSLVGLIQWTPFAAAPANPFTGKAATDLNDDKIDANPPAVIYGLVFDLLRKEQTGGWLSASVGVLGLFSPAAQPEDDRFYTHKFLPELSLDVGIFQWLREGNLLRNLTAYGLVDYVATGLSDAGDPAPGGGILLSDADPWILIAGLRFPLAPTPIAR